MLFSRLEQSNIFKTPIRGEAKRPPSRAYQEQEDLRRSDAL